MTPEKEYGQRLKEILDRDSRYAAMAYEFMRVAVSFTTEKLKGEGSPARRHISGQQLLDGIRELALQQFGPLTLNVLSEWGIYNTTDFGNIVFNLVEAELLGASENDSISDFENGYDFRTAFVEPFFEHGPLPTDVKAII